MPATFEASRHVAQLYVAFGRVKQLVADFRANEKFHLSPTYCCDGLDHRIGPLICGLHGFIE